MTATRTLDSVVDDFIRFYGDAVSRCAHEHGWWDIDGGDRNMGEMLMLMTSELAEGLEAYRDGEPLLWYDHDGSKDPNQEGSASFSYNGNLGKPCGLVSEFADTIIRILDTNETLKFPLATALIQKHEYNLTRPYRHGGKAC